MTKSELIKKNGVYMCDNSGVHDAMDEYAKQEAVEFYGWVKEQPSLFLGEYPESVYEKYIESKNKTQ